MTGIKTYKDAAAFRAALEDRLRLAAATKGQAWLVQQRKFIVFDRLLARLLVVAPNRWILKGAVALDFRLGDRARATVDLDIGRHDNEEAATNDLLDAQAIDLGDFFTFQIERARRLNVADVTAVRYQVAAALDDRRFERITLDVGITQPVNQPPDILTGPNFFGFAGIPPIEVPALPLEHHVAEKLHAYTRIYGDGRQSTRVKDLIDLVLIQSAARFEAQRLRQAIVGTFATREGQTVPIALPPPPQNWATPYRAMAEDVGLSPDMETGHESVARFLNPILAGTVLSDAKWDPELARWEPSDGP